MNSWIRKDLKYIWHPYTQMKDCAKLPPILIEAAKGVRLYGRKKKFYYDTISSWWCNVHGHNHPKINEAIKRQLGCLEHVLFAGFTHRPAISLAEKLVMLAPDNLTKVFFSDNGSSCVEVALKMSFQYWHNIGKAKKLRFVSLDHGYHGDTIGAMSVSGVGLFNELFAPLFFRSYKSPAPYCYRCPMGKERADCDIDCIKPMRQLLEKRSKEIAAIILEPLVMAAGGMIIYPKEFLEKAAGLAGEFGVHLIVDEVATAFGRTGRMFASEYADCRPDFICLSKGITSGYLPLAATLTTEKVYRAFFADYKEKKTFYHGHTYTANPISCSAALASLEIFKEEDTLRKASALHPLLRARLEEFNDLPLVGDTRSIGLVGAIELVKDRRRKRPFGFNERIGLEVYKKALKKNLVLRPLGSVVYLFLPLCVREAELNDILDRMWSVIESLS